MNWQTIAASILTLAAAGPGLARVGGAVPAAGAGACLEGPAEGLMQPFSRPGWSRAGAGGGQSLEEARWWPIPLIAPGEPLRADRFGFRIGPPPAYCFSPKTPPSPDQLARMEERMRGPLQNRFYVTNPWPSRTVYWSFVQDGVIIPDTGPDDDGTGLSTLFSSMDAKFAGDRALWIAEIQSCFNRWANLSGLTFVRVRHNGQEWDDGAIWGSGYSAGLRGDIRIAMRNIDGLDNILAFNYFPDSGGDMVIDITEDWSDPANGYRKLRNVVMHEIGHGIGIDHVCPQDSSKLMEPGLNTNFWGPQHDDVRAVQSLYGDVYAGNHTAATARPRGALAPSTTDVIGPISGTPVSFSSLVSIAGANADWYSYDLSVPTGLSVRVDPVGTTYVNAVQLSNGDCTNGSSFNSTAAKRLEVSLLAADGTSVIQTMLAPAGGQTAGPIFITQMPTGRFYVRVSSPDTSAQTQMYNLLVSSAAATPPINDACAHAQAIGVGTVSGDNGGANTDGSAGTCGASSRDVWYVFNSQCRGTLDIDTCGSTLDTVLSVYSGECGALSQRACNDDAPVGSPCGGTASALSVEVEADQSYYIRVAGKSTTPGLFTLNVNRLAPANDLCANAVTLTIPGNVSATTCGARREGTSSCAPGSGSPDVWYRYVATCSGVLRINACVQNELDTVFSVHSGACGALNQITCNADSPECPSGGSFLLAPVTLGETYFIRVSGFSGQAGRFEFDWSLTQLNDACSSASAITPASYLGSTCGARRDLINTCQAGSSSPDVFYSYIPATSGLMTVTTCGSSFDTLLEVLTGPCNALTSIACNDNHNSSTCNTGPTTSRTTVSVTAGLTYIIRVSGRNNQSGPFTLNLFQAPANDLCANAQTITTGVTGNTTYASRDGSDTCAPGSTSPDLWYRWVAPCTGTLTVNTCGSLYNTVASIHTGACGGLTQLSCNDDIGLVGCQTRADASTTFTAVSAGQTYFIRISGALGESGVFTMNLTQGPANDQCAQAIGVPQGNTLFDTRCATNDGTVACGASTGSPDVWYRFASPCSGAVWFNTCGSTLDTVLSVRSGDCVSGVTQCNDNQGILSCAGNPNTSRLAVRATAGNIYTIRIAGNFGSTGTGTLNIRCCPADFNLSFTVSVQDIFDFLAAYFANNPLADINLSGSISVQDIFDYLAAYFAGCP